MTEQTKQALRKVKTVNRQTEMEIDSFIIDMGARHQFIKDVRVYNMLEAVLYARDYNVTDYNQFVEAIIQAN